MEKLEINDFIFNAYEDGYIVDSSYSQNTENICTKYNIPIYMYENLSILNDSWTIKILDNNIPIPDKIKDLPGVIKLNNDLYMIKSYETALLIIQYLIPKYE